ncbi:hypothetical protein COBT_003994, partial [Conglomerata obtusa]
MNMTPSKFTLSDDTKEKMVNIFKCYELRAKKNILIFDCILHISPHSLIYLINEYKLVLKRISPTFEYVRNITNHIEPWSVEYNHSNIVCTYISFTQVLVFKKYIWLVMEYLPVKISENLLLKDYQVKTMSNDIMSGLEYLHSRNIAHLDINPSNILGTRISLQNYSICDIESMNDLLKHLRENSVPKNFDDKNEFENNQTYKNRQYNFCIDSNSSFENIKINTFDVNTNDKNVNAYFDKQISKRLYNYNPDYINAASIIA